MAAITLAGLFQSGIDILKTTINTATKRILVSTGNNGPTQTSETDSVEWWQHVGFASRPAVPDAGKNAAQGFIIRAGDYDICLASQDMRGLDIYGSLGDGETCVYAPGKDSKGQARALFKNDGSIHLYTRVKNDPNGAGMVIQLDAQNDAIRLLNSKGYGLIIDANGVRATSIGAGLTLSPSGDVTLVGKGKCQIDGSGICLGSTAVPVANGALVGPTGLAGVCSTKVLIALA